MHDLFVLVILQAKKGREEALQRDLVAVVEPSRRDEGNLRYELFVDKSDQHRFVFLEHWANQESQERHHRESEHIRRFQKSGSQNIEKIEVFYQLRQIA